MGDLLSPLPCPHSLPHSELLEDLENSGSAHGIADCFVQRVSIGQMPVIYTHWGFGGREERQVPRALGGVMPDMRAEEGD